MINTRTTRRMLAAATIAAAGFALLGGCRGERTEKPPRQFIPDMDDSPKFKNQSRTEFFADGRSMRPRVPGAVAFGDSMDPDSLHRANYLKADTIRYAGYDPAKPKSEEGDPAYVPVMPASVVDAWIAEAATRGLQRDPANPADRQAAVSDMLTRGHERFNIYCSACHGFEGDGRGLVGVRWGYAVPSFHDPKYSDRSVKTGLDGYLFHVIQNGVPDTAGKAPKMPAYADKVDVADSWAIVTYIRALQAARTSAPAKAESTQASERPLSAATPATEVNK